MMGDSFQSYRIYSEFIITLCALRYHRRDCIIYISIRSVLLSCMNIALLSVEQIVEIILALNYLNILDWMCDKVFSEPERHMAEIPIIYHFTTVICVEK